MFKSLPSTITAAGIAVAAALTVTPALASTYNWPIDRDIVIVPTSGPSFHDIFNFTLGGGTNLSGGGSSSPFSVTTPFGALSLPAITFTSVLLTGPTGTIWSSSPGNSSFSFLTSNLGFGNYSLSLSGSSGVAGAYAVSLLTAPVPEPGEWAMILAGLGILGVMVRRRSGN